MALLISVGNLGGIAGSNIFIASQAPKYPTGFGVGLGMCCAAIAMAFFLRTLYATENRKRRELIETEGEEAIRARYSEQELLDSKSVSNHLTTPQILTSLSGRQESVLHLYALAMNVS